MKSTLGRVWHWVRWPVGILFFAYIALVLYRIPAIGEQEKTEKAVAYIHAQKITLADVEGTNLPPVPNKEKNDATVEGIDANNNGVRDDVELAIFEKYPNSARVRAAELQYAMALQLMITNVFNADTWKAAAIETSRGYSCIASIYPRDDLNKHIQMTDLHTQEVKDFVLNTELRKNAENRAYDFFVSYGLPNTNFCNLDLSILAN